jgi:transcriptional regulator with GAF, ATPase, and Fis domain
MPCVPPVPIPPAVVGLLEKRNYPRLKSVQIINRLEDWPTSELTISIMFPDLGKAPKVSLLMTRLMIDGGGQGLICLIATGTNRFSSEHAELLDVVREPLALALSNAVQFRELAKLNELLANENRELASTPVHTPAEEVIGADLGLRATMELVYQVSDCNAPVLILGETGTGKEVIATAIHELSSRCHGAFIKVNCAALPETLIDSELFGHEKGAFTGALCAKPGRFERANRGTIFLDEIGDLPLSVQGRLLRVLESHEIERLGSRDIIHVNVRIIAATHRNVRKMVDLGQFREDLWFRLNVFPISVPPLRERGEDIPELLRRFLTRKAFQLGIHEVPQISEEAFAMLQAYPWPGNVRELQNAVEGALIRLRRGSDSVMLEPKHFLLDRPGTESYGNLVQEVNNSLTLEGGVRDLIKNALAQTAGKIQGPGGAADLLRVNPNTLRSKIRKMKIPVGATVKKAMYAS